MSFSTPAATLGEMLSLARQLGYDAIEPRAAGGHRHGVELTATPAQRQAIRRQSVDAGIPICCIATGCRYANPATAPANVEETLRYIDLAADIACPRLRVFGGDFPREVSREAAIESQAASLRAVAGHAAACGITICMETHDAWCDPRHVADVMKLADDPAVAVNWDIMHPIRQGRATMDEAYTVLKPWIRHVHAHDGRDIEGKLRVLPIGQGIIDHPGALRLLRQGGYDGFISGEWLQGIMSPDFFASHLATEIQTLRQLADNLDG